VTELILQVCNGAAPSPSIWLDFLRHTRDILLVDREAFLGFGLGDKTCLLDGEYASRHHRRMSEPDPTESHPTAQQPSSKKAILPRLLLRVFWKVIALFPGLVIFCIGIAATIMVSTWGPGWLESTISTTIAVTCGVLLTLLYMYVASGPYRLVADDIVRVSKAVDVSTKYDARMFWERISSAGAWEKIQKSIPDILQNGAKLIARLLSLGTVGLLLANIVLLANLALAWIQLERITEQNVLISNQNGLLDREMKSVGVQTENSSNSLKLQREALDLQRQEFELRKSAALKDSAEIQRGGEPLIMPWANLANAKSLSGANLIGANLTGVNLTRADLSKTYLFSSNLEGADFSYAKLQGAILRTANLRGASFHGAVMTDADLTGAQLASTDFTDASLKNTQLPHIEQDAALVLHSCEVDEAVVPDQESCNRIKRIIMRLKSRPNVRCESLQNGRFKIRCSLGIILDEM